MPVAMTESKTRSVTLPRVLIVDDEPDLRELITDLLPRHLECKVSTAASVAEARALLAAGPVEVLVTDLNLPDGDGISLLAALHDRQPSSTGIVITGQPSIGGAVNALRSGAIDFVPKPFTAEQIVDRIRNAVDRQAEQLKRDRRLDRLQDAVGRLNRSRKMISKKVDLLCNDLIGAYDELSKQMEVVRYEEGFRKHIEKAEDLEQFLCHAMDWMLRQIGYANVAVYLSSDDGAFQLGAYMKYTIAGDPAITDLIKRVIVPMASKAGIIRIDPKDLADRMTPAELARFKGQDIIAANCTYLGESLASLVFFRDSRSPFTDDDAPLLKQIAPIFAVELASIVREEADEEDDEAEPESGGATPFDDADFDGNQKEANEKPRKRKSDPADWWKRGETPPF